MPEWSCCFIMLPPSPPGPLAPTACTTSVTATLPAFSNSSVTGSLSPCFSGLFSYISIR